MKFNIIFLLVGPAGKVEAPNSSNPVECENLASLLTLLAQNLPQGLGVSCVGVLVTPE